MYPASVALAASEDKRKNGQPITTHYILKVRVHMKALWGIHLLDIHFKENGKLHKLSLKSLFTNFLEKVPCK